MRALVVAVALTAVAVALAGCGSSRTLQPALRGAGGERAAEFREIKVARSTNPVLLSIFPKMPRTQTCLIPSGGITSLELRGSCETTVHTASPRGEILRVVTFTERWTPLGCKARVCGRHHSWIVWVNIPTTVEPQRPVVIATHARGASPPQAND